MHSSCKADENSTAPGSDAQLRATVSRNDECKEVTVLSAAEVLQGHRIAMICASLRQPCRCALRRASTPPHCHREQRAATQKQYRFVSACTACDHTQQARSREVRACVIHEVVAKSLYEQLGEVTV